MKTIVLAAGYATRMYPLTEDFPKPLLPVGETTILDRLLSDIDHFEDIDGHIIVTNHKFIDQFSEWQKKCNYKKPLTVLSDGSVSNESRLGAVKDLMLAIETCQLWEEDLLVIAADNVLDFSFSGFIGYFKTVQSSLIMYYHEPSIEKLQRTGVITLDPTGRVISMEEKPKNPPSHFAVPPFYLYEADDVRFIRDTVNAVTPSNDDHGILDAPGNLVRLMLSKTTFHAWPMPGNRYDVGSLESYRHIRENCPPLLD